MFSLLLDVQIFVGNEVQTAEYKASPGTYKIECWGGEGYLFGGKGGYASGFITFRSTKTLYVFVGGYGKSGEEEPG